MEGYALWRVPTGGAGPGGTGMWITPAFIQAVEALRGGGKEVVGAAAAFTAVAEHPFGDEVVDVAQGAVL